MPDVDQDETAAQPDRRTVRPRVRGEGRGARRDVAVAACGGDSGSSTATPARPAAPRHRPGPAAPAVARSSPRPTSRSAAARSSTARRWSSPSRRPGTFKAFSAICTHQGCTGRRRVGRHHHLPVPRAASSPSRPAPSRRARPPGRCRQDVTVDADGIRHLSPVPPARSPSAVAARRVAGVADPSTYRPAPGDDPDRPGRLPVPRRARPGHLRRQGQEPAAAADLLLPGPRGAAPAHPHDGHHRAPASSGPSSPPRSRRCSWSTPGSRSSTRASTSSTATTSPTRTSPSRWARSSRGCR